MSRGRSEFKNSRWLLSRCGPGYRRQFCGDMKIGFIEADIEGHVLEMVEGALRTPKRKKSIISISCYHNIDEFFGVPMLLFHDLPDYYFELHFGNNAIQQLDELSIFGCPGH
jgi:hypothetical protein